MVDDINLKFYPDSEFESLIEVQSYNQILYTASDFENTPPDLKYGTVNQRVFLDQHMMEQLDSEQIKRILF